MSTQHKVVSIKFADTLKLYTKAHGAKVSRLAAENMDCPTLLHRQRTSS